MTDPAAESGAGRTIRTARVILASSHTLFGLLTGTGAQASWRCRTSRGTLNNLEVDARVGGSFRYTMSINGVDHDASGRYLELSPPNRLVCSWTWTAGDMEVRDNIVTIELTDLQDGSCRAVVTQEKLPSRALAAAQAALWSNKLQDLALHVA